MTYYEHFRENYELGMASVHFRRDEVIEKARALQPENLDELVAAANGEDIEDYELAWVDVPNPWQQAPGDTITARPVLGLTEGYEDAEREKDVSDRGVWKLGIETLLPSGDSWYLGDIMFFYSRGQLKHEPGIALNTEPTDNSFGMNFVKWNSADAELFLRLAQSVLDAQPK